MVVNGKSITFAGRIDGMMKKIGLFMSLGIVLLLVGCIADEVGGVYLVTEQVDDLPSAQGHGAEVFFQAGGSWKATSSASWLEVDPSEGQGGRNGITVHTVESNHTRDRRKATVTIESGGKQQQLTVWQRNEYALFNPKVYTIGAEGGEVEMAFSSNVSKDSLLISYIPMDWIGFEGDSLRTPATRASEWNGRVRKLVVHPNPQPAERSAYFLLVMYGEQRRTLYQVLDTAWVHQQAMSQP